MTTLLPSGRRGLWRTFDGGATWARAAGDLPETISVVEGELGLVIGGDPKAIYFKGSSGLYLSRDAGDTWASIALPGGSTAGLTIDPVHSERLLLPYEGFSTDWGVTWTAFEGLGTHLDGDDPAG
jgi:photosystem II stability/assembly factor-like uncharacterized protein